MLWYKEAIVHRQEQESGMPKFTHTHALWLLLPALLLSACANISKSERMDDLNNTLKNYKRDIRWGEFDTAWSFRRWEEGKREEPPETLKGLRVTDYKVVNTHMGADNLSYTQTAHISYHLADSPSVRKIVDRQKWEYDGEAKRWWLVSNMPQF